MGNNTLEDRFYAKLEEFLASVDAKPVWEIGHGFTIYNSNGRLFIVQKLQPFGWEIFVPACNSLLISDTLEATRKYLGKTKEG